MIREDAMIINLYIKVLTGFLLLVMMSAAWANSLSKIRVGQSPEQTRIVFEVKNNNQFEVSHLSNPSRIVVDFYNSKNEVSFKSKRLLDPRVKGIRISHNNKRTRVVLDLRNSFDYRYFTLGKTKSGAERVVIDVKKQLAVAKKPSVTPKAKIKPEPKVVLTKTQNTGIKNNKTSVLSKREVKPPSLINSPEAHKLFKSGVPLIERDEIVVAVDAGHGGRDPGAIGLKYNTYEKVVTLQIAKKLKKHIDKQPGMRAVLIRDRDVFIPLVQRVRIANRKDADIFISIHADSFPQLTSVGGASVFVLSTSGASSVMARMLARNENASLHDMKLKGRDSDVAFLLTDLSREANIRASRKLAGMVLGEMGKKVRLHQKNVQSAGFAVLKSIDMPSLLIEAAFLSNPDEEKKLMNQEFQTRLAKSVASGLSKFAQRNATQPRWGESLFVHYKVQSGDTLSQIAQNHGIATAELKKINGIKNPNRLYAGKKLRIPLSEQVVAGL